MSINQITHKQYLYHVTDVKNVKKILKEGLKRKGAAVYLSENPFSWWKPEMAILRVRVTGLKDKMTRVDNSLDELLVWDDIPAVRVSRYTSSEKKLREAEKRYYFTHPKEGYKYSFAVYGIVEVVKFFHTDAEALEYCDKLKAKDGRNWRVYNRYGDLVYGVVVIR